MDDCTWCLQKYVPAVADGDDSFGSFLEALRTVRGSDRRLSPYRDYRAFLDDEEIRSAIDETLALATPPPPSGA
ncbi:hypothetical protein [Streptomyces sp. NPDC004270]